MSSPRTPSNLAPSLEEKIRFRAYELFEQRGGEPGRDLDDWLQAEADIVQQKLGPIPLRAAPAKKVRGRRNGH